MLPAPDLREHVHGAVSKPPLSSASLQIAGQGKSLQAALPPPKKAVSSFSFLLTSPDSHSILGPRPSPWGALSAPYPNCLNQSPNSCRLNPISGSFLFLSPSPEGSCHPREPSNPTPSQGGGGWADLGSSEPCRAASSPRPAYSAPSPTRPLGLEKGGCEGGRGFRGHSRPRGRVGSRLPV